MALKALLCSGDDESPQHRSVLRAIHTLNSPKNYILSKAMALWRETYLAKCHDLLNRQSLMKDST